MQYILFFLIVLGISFCNSQNSGTVNPDYRNAKNDTIRKEIPLTRTGEYFYFYNVIRDLSKTLKLNSIEHGIDSLEIRIWFPEMSTSTVVIISKLPGGWVASLCRFTYEYDILKSIDTIIGITKTILKPKSGWQKLSTDLLSLGITSLPNCESIPGYSGVGADGEGYIVEVATVDKYRMYSYYDLSENQNIGQARFFKLIIELVKKEFGIDYK